MNSKFAFLVHPGYPASVDTRQICWIFKFLSDDTIGRIFKFRIKFSIFKLRIDWKFPLIVKAVRDTKTKSIKGWIIGVTATAKQIVSISDHDFVFDRIKDAVALAEKLGAKYVGLGSLISPFLHGGEDIVKHFPEIIFTNGNSFTGFATADLVERIFRFHGLNPQKDKVAIFGATGSVGHAVADLLAEQKMKLIIYARRAKELATLKEELLQKYNNQDIEIATNPIEMAGARILVVVVSGIGLKVAPEFVNDQGIIIDVTRPKNTTEEILEARPRVIVLDGGIVNIPDMKHGMKTGLGENEVFACFTETALMAENNISGNRVGYATGEDAKLFGEIFKRSPQRSIVSYRSFGKKI